MSVPTLESVIAAFYTVLATSTDAAPIALRAALGAGAASVTTADALGTGALPAAPFVVLGSGVIVGSPGWDTQRAVLPWWVYDDVTPSYMYRKINHILTLIQACYPADTEVITGCEHRQLAITAGRPDAALGGRPARSIPYQVSWR